MPASGGDPVVSALRFGFSGGAKMNSNIDNGIEASAKRVLSTRIGFEVGSNYQTNVLTSLKSKYIVFNTKTSVSNGKTNGVNGVNGHANGNGVNGASKKAGAAKLPVPKCTLFATEKVQLGFRGSLSVGSGMVNLGNTCYLNSTLQALFHVPSFVNWLLNEPTHFKCEQNSDYQMHPDDITCAVIKTFKLSQQKTGTAMKPLSIYSKLKAICKHLSQGSQEDAHEFMRYLLESIEKGFLTKIQGHNLESWSKETTPVNQIFGGYIRTEVDCLSCRAVSTTFQHFQDLPLDIRKASTLNDALSGYFERERLPEGEDAYKCEKCGRKVAATKKFSIERPPNVLCVQLKRFSMMNGKLTKQVQLPQNLDLGRFLSQSVRPRNPVRYRLVSMVTHMGQSANCGHYTAIALAANGHYYQFDDGSVRQIPLLTVQNMSAYLVLYELERPFLSNNSRPAASAAETSQRESESASVGGSKAKEPANGGSPTAGSPAPRTSPAPAATSLVPYDYDADSDAENKESEASSGSWKVTPVIKPRPPAPPVTKAWRVTDVQAPSRRPEATAAATPAVGNGEARSPVAAMDTSDKALCDSVVRQTAKQRDVVSEMLQNSHRGYGSNQVRSWNGLQSNMERQVDQERRESRKRTYDEEYNADFDRGKSKKRRTFDNRDSSRGRFNPFQQRANEQNNFRFRNEQYKYPMQRPHQGNQWAPFRRNNHNKNNYNKHYNNNYNNRY